MQAILNYVNLWKKSRLYFLTLHINIYCMKRYLLIIITAFPCFWFAQSKSILSLTIDIDKKPDSLSNGTDSSPYSRTPCEYLFSYDIAGNQILRNKNGSCGITLSRDLLSKTKQESVSDATGLINNDLPQNDFFKEVKIYPNPVKDYLTVEWSEAVGQKIYQVMVFQHSNLHWVYTSDKTALANRKFKLNMQELPYGVYVLTFILQDGKRISANVSKLQ